MKYFIVLFAVLATSLAMPVEEFVPSDAVIADIDPVRTELHRVDSPLSANEEQIPVAIIQDGEQRELVRPKRFLLLKKLAVAKALGVGALGVGLVGAAALKGGIGGGGGGGYGGNSGGYGGGYGGYGGGSYGGYGNSYGGGSGYGGYSGGGGGYGNGYHKTIVVWD